MTIATPIQSEIILKHIVNGNYWDRPIMVNYPDFEVCFLAFHPFYKIKQGHEDKIKFKIGKWPNKKAVIDNCDKLTWTEFMKISGILEYKDLDAALSFREWARSSGDKKYFDILSQILNIKYPEIIAPQTDSLSDILVNDILLFLKRNMHDNFYIYDDTDNERIIKTIDAEIKNDNGVVHQRIETIDKRLLIVTDFDCHHSYFLGDKKTISELVTAVDLEGFYCDKLTTRNWSYEPIIPERKVEIEYTNDKKHFTPSI